MVRILQSPRSQPSMMPGGLQPVEHLLDVGRDAVLVLGDEVELAAEEVEHAPDRRRALLADPALALGAGRVGAVEGQLHRADSLPNWLNQELAEAEILLVDDPDLVVVDDGGLVDRLQVVLAVVGLERDVDPLGQVLQAPPAGRPARGSTLRPTSRRPPALRAVIVPPPESAEAAMATLTSSFAFGALTGGVGAMSAPGRPAVGGVGVGSLDRVRAIGPAPVGRLGGRRWAWRIRLASIQGVPESDPPGPARRD